MRLVNRGVDTRRRYAVVQELVDVPEFIDYMLLNLYGANADWDRSSNWYAGRRRQPPGAFEFFVWDGERTLEAVDSNILEYDDDESPPRLFQKLRQNERFRREFAARARKHLLGNGALAPGPAAARYSDLARQIEQAVVLESARWGSYRHDVHPYKTGPYELYTRDEYWRPEINRLLQEYFPRRSAEILKQLERADLASSKD
jgi:hypothetical protein